MINIKTPDSYVSGEYVLEKCGKHISKLGKYALIICGKTAWSKTQIKILSSLTKERIEYKIEKYEGYCTFNSIEKYAEIAKQLKVDIIVGVGGGKIMDLAKAVGEMTKLSVITIHTIAATCAAWSALSVIYDNNGQYTDYIILSKAPKIILVDINVILDAPIRYLNSGIADSIVKWYEILPNLHSNDDISLKIGLQTAKLALIILEKYTTGLYVESNNNYITNGQYKDVIDSIIILAGLAGSFRSQKNIISISHSIHDSLTYIPETKYALHGQKVIFGLIVQFILEKKTDKEIYKLIDFANALSLPVTLKQLGIKYDVSNSISNIASGVHINSCTENDLNFNVNYKLIKQAIAKADQLGTKSLKRKYNKENEPLSAIV
ncbi:iron-containing alcohol dehydrogenase family protein [Clostridium tyrobutyricum]|uniref:iron-containing alcohol dehydrogenase family protein n=1 Tax=Clostridium tyrobutyricum TaxID=1519 RepID=UPI001C3E5C78|nr:iron-containing alcohol dehydrogenase family protein [Clostridium tyrobutyricum]MBV4437852.1 iron-containing alcohol dehydrogenase family protein [Clostridium tyrobutyricum]